MSCHILWKHKYYAKIENYLNDWVRYLCRMDEAFEAEWNSVVARIEKQFGEDIDLQGILFLVGVQELGQGLRKFSKDEKLDVMHIAICTLLSRYGYYEFAGNDDEGWPHWNATEKLPSLKPFQQQRLMKEALIEYFKEEESNQV